MEEVEDIIPEEPTEFPEEVEEIPEPPYQPTQQEIYQHLIQQRQQQAYMRHQAMLAPYQNMFASRAR